VAVRPHHATQCSGPLAGSETPPYHVDTEAALACEAEEAALEAFFNKKLKKNGNLLEIRGMTLRKIGSYTLSLDLGPGRDLSN